MHLNPSSHLAALLLSAAVLATSFAPASTAGTLATLYAFTAGLDGSGPESAVIRDAIGTLYGEAGVAGGAICVNITFGPAIGCGTLFSFSAAAGLKTLIEFSGLNGSVGTNTPLLVGDTLYGSASEGGVTNNGTLFSIHTDGTGFTILHHFTGLDGSGPTAPLVLGPDGAFYGVTSYGGPSYTFANPYGSYGVLFRITTTGQYSILHAFTNGSDGATPTSLVVEKTGTIIGATYFGGNKISRFCGSYGCGVVYAYDPATNRFTVPHTYTGKLGDGAYPGLGSLAADGTAYGNASGAFFSIGPTTGYTAIPTNSYPPQGIGFGGEAGPTLGMNGSLTEAQPILDDCCGMNEPGDLYQQLNGVITDLWDFSDGADGGYPYGQPLLSPTGTFLGTTSGGGPNPACNCGTLYEYTP